MSFSGRYSDGKYFERFSIGEIGVREEIASVPQETVYRYDESLSRLFLDDPRSLRRLNLPGGLAQLPYIFLGAANNEVFGSIYEPAGERSLLETQTDVTYNKHLSTEEVLEIKRLIKILQKGKKIVHNEEVACLRKLEKMDGRWRVEIGCGTYEDFYYSNGSDNLSFRPEDWKGKVSPDVMKQLEEWRKSWEGSKPANVREACYQLYGGVPDFHEGVYGNTIGVASVLISSDGYFVFAKRNPKYVGVNSGINCPASGGVKWNEELLRNIGLAGANIQAIEAETSEELGLNLGQVMGFEIGRYFNTIGIENGDYDLSMVGAMRELPRGGSPEFFFLAQARLDRKTIIQKIQNNDHRDKLEAAEIVTIPCKQAYDLIEKPQESSIHHKGVMNMVLVREYFKNKGIRF